MFSNQLLNNTSSNFTFVFIIYVFTFIITSIMPISVFILIFALALKDTFLALRIAIISIVVLINNQFVLSAITDNFFDQTKLHVYVIGILFYFIIFLLIKLFSKTKLTKAIKLFMFITILVFFMSYQNFFKSILFLFNVVGGFLG